MKKVYIKERKRQAGQFQFYMPQFVEAAKRQGLVAKDSGLYNLCFKLNGLLSRISRKLKKRRKPLSAAPSSQAQPPLPASSAPAPGGAFRKVARLLYPYLNKRHKKKAILVAARGETLFMNAFPFFYRYEIIPMLWDVWPNTWPVLFHDLKFLGCKTVFVTVRSMAEKISEKLGINAYWIPEGIDSRDYRKGDDLMFRTVDVYELGRQHKKYHAVLEQLHKEGGIGVYRRNIYAEDGGLKELAFPTADDLLKGFPQIKVIVSFPQIDTHPEKAGGLDTLTQRYWEAMLSRCLIVGRAPQELIDLIGYNPVVDVDWQQPEQQLSGILQNIADYQPLVDKNHEVAKRMAAWDNRIADIKEILQKQGYVL